MPAYSMQLAPVQRGAATRRAGDGRFVPDTTGPTSFCLNLRERVPGMMESVSRQKVITNFVNEPFAIDVRDRRTNIFTLSGTSLRLEGYLDSDNNFHRLDMPLADLGEQPASSCSAGQFFIITLRSGELFYLLWNPDTDDYSVPGRLPAIPQMRLACIDTRQTVADIPAQTFPSPVADLRGGIPQSVARQLGDAVVSARDSALESLESAGYWTAPVLVRAAIRLWDGSLLHVSDPQIVVPYGGYQGGGRVLLKAVLDPQKGFTGTQASSISCSGFRINASLSSPLPEEWSAVARGVEFWVTEPQQPFPSDVEPQVSANQSGSTYSIGITPAQCDPQKLVAELPSQRMARAGSISLFTGTEVELYRPSGPYSRPFAGTPRSASYRAAAILGHGAFLHLGNLSRSLPLPSLPGGMPESANGSAVVTVEVNVGDRRTVISRRTSATSPSISPLIWYPSAEAVKATVTFSCAGKVYRKEFPLRPVPGGEDAAFRIGIENEQLPEVAAGVPIPTDDVVAEERMPGGVLTMLPGNPFVAASLTRDCGGYISSLAAMPTGGGAYTRQFIYALTDKGIMALTHDRNGLHTNCRSISAEVPAAAGSVCNAADSVWVATRSGSLLRIRDARPETMISGLHPVDQLAWNARLGELWLVAAEPGAGTLVIQTRCANRAYMRTLEPRRFLDRSGTMLFTADVLEKSANSFLCIPDDLVAPSGSDLRLQLEYVSGIIAPPAKGKVFAAIEMQGTTDADVELYAASPANSESHTGSRRLMAVNVRGRLSTPLMVAVAMPSSGELRTPARQFPARPSLRLRLRGKFESFTGFSFVGAERPRHPC